MKQNLLIAALLWCSLSAVAQQNFWNTVNEGSVGRNLFEAKQRPAAYKIFQLNETAFRSALQTAPTEKLVPVAQSPFIISMPDANGQLQSFKVVEAPVMDPLLAARYPGIQSYAGVAVSNAGTSIRFSISPQGFHGMILSLATSTVYIDPLADNYYLVVARTEAANYRQSFTCETIQTISEEANTAVTALRNADDGRLRTYRLALVASGEFSQFWLNGSETSDAERKAKVLAAMNDKMTRVNGIYERDFGVRLILIANNDAVIYLNAATDPIGTTSSSWNSQTQSTCTNVIGSANYDVGHLVHRGPTNNGNAGCIGCVCTAATKGSGWTSYIDLASDYFVVDYLTHELGHQFGANHTFTHANEGTTVQVEPGSGSTIMGYAGITGATTDVQVHSDDYFHSKSIEQVTNYIKSASGSCAVSTITGNLTPVANAGADFVIPRSTPFILSGTGSDADAADVLSFSWEQTNQRATGFSTVPSATATAGPQFRSYLPVSGTSRTFPRLSDVLSGTNANKWEVLPSVARTLNFRFTVRDNHPGGGNNKSDDMIVTVNGTAGPFAVTVPNTAVTWIGNAAQTVSWSVNSTNLAPVNCTNVKISISVDGGASFSTLVASTPNDGSEVITVPNTATTTARIKVEAVGNIFFDISNTNFTITGGAACGNPGGLTTSAITTSSASLSWSAVSGAVSYDVDYKATADANWISLAAGTTGTSVNLAGLTQATSYDWRVRANCATESSTYTVAQFSTTAPFVCNVPSGLTNTGITSSAASISWTAVSGALSYDVDYKLNTSATWIPAAVGTTALTVNLTGLSAASLYDWRVRTNCTGESSGYSQAQFTTAAVSTCPGIYDVSTNGTRGGAAIIPFNTDIKGLISPSGDNDYYRFSITTAGTITVALSALPADYDLRLYRNNTQVAISQNSGTANETINYTATTGTYYARVYGFNNANNATNCYNLRVNLGTASRADDLITAKSVSVFPNPVTKTVNVSIPDIRGMASIRVFDIYGKLIQQRSSTQMNTALDFSGMPAGVYMIKILNDGKESTLKVVKQ